jgi:hypothetical protein
MTTMTDTMKVGEVALLKQDNFGRVKTPAARREQLLDEFERSQIERNEVCSNGGRQIPGVCVLGVAAVAATRIRSGRSKALWIQCSGWKRW